jgi:hypothetical protein
MESKHGVIASGTRSIRRAKLALAGLFLVALGGFVVATVSVAVRGVGEVVSTVALPAYLAASVALPLLVLTDAGRGILDWVRDSRSGSPVRSRMLSSIFAAVEVALAALMLLVFGGLAYLRLTQSPGPGAGGILVGGMLVISFVGSCLAVVVLIGGVLGVRSYPA